MPTKRKAEDVYDINSLLKKHIELGPYVRVTRNCLLSFSVLSAWVYGTSDKHYKMIHNMLNSFEKIRVELDSEICRIAPNDFPATKVYYGGIRDEPDNIFSKDPDWLIQLNKKAEALVPCNACLPWVKRRKCKHWRYEHYEWIEQIYFLMDYTLHMLQMYGIIVGLLFNYINKKLQSLVKKFASKLAYTSEIRKQVTYVMNQRRCILIVLAHLHDRTSTLAQLPTELVAEICSYVLC